MIGLELVSGPVAEPVSLDEVKTQARIDGTADDAFLGTLIVAARQWTEQYTGRALMTQNWRLWLDQWPVGNDPWWEGTREGSIVAAAAQVLSLPKAPLQSVTEVRVYQGDDSSTVWPGSAYQVDNAAAPGRLILRAGQSWPIPGRAAQGIAVLFIAGYANAAAVPEPVKAALRQLVTHWYEQRGETAPPPVEAPYGVRALLNPYRMRQFL